MEDGGHHRRDDARQVLRKLNQGDDWAENKFVILRCPWCSAAMGPIERANIKGRPPRSAPKVAGYVEDGGTVVFRCPDARCDFATGLPVFVIAPSPRGQDSVHGKVVSNIQEIRARGARTIVIAEDGDEDVVPFADTIIRVPRTPTLLAPLVTTVPLQVFACELALAMGHDVDQPRNLAKSVTVE